MKRKFNIWPFLIVGFLAMNVCVGGALVYFATNDPSFAVEDDYYEKGLDWDETARQRQLNEQLGWRVSIVEDAAQRDVLRLSVVDKQSDPVENAAVRVTAFHQANMADKTENVLRPIGPGVYEAPLRIDPPGIWEFRIEVRHADTRFTDVQKHEL